MGKNRLAEQSSLYLRQHADNPVHWWPWCEEAFEVAQREQKPVLVSIGYSSCHWCHVMAHECFEDDYIASLMNRLFINIKVDREERPDVDQIYMEAVQMLNQQGGWPLNVFCFPDKTPFTGGTYFPPEDQGFGIIPWPHLLLRISDAFREQRDELRQNADAIRNNLHYLSGPTLEDPGAWENSLLLDGAQVIVETLDARLGGFGGTPKFPPSQTLGYLMAVRRTRACEQEMTELARSIDEALQICCHALVRGGLFDHVGGGFFRYSVDAEWRVPHFEKMLYDNALLLETLSKASTQYRWQGLEAAVRKTVRWLQQDFQIHPGVFAAALDADSEAGEGAYYLWSEAELREAVPASRVEDFLETFAIRGKDALNLYPWSAKDADYRSFAPVLEDLRDLREQRPAPTLDRKVLTAWNGLLLRGLSIAAWVWGEKDWLETVKQGLDWLWEHHRREDGTLATVSYPESGAVGEGDGFLDDYVNFALANLQFAMVADWLQVGFCEQYRERAVILASAVLERFADAEGDGFFFCSTRDAAGHIVRKKEWFDNAYPSGNSGMLHLCSLLSVQSHDLALSQAMTSLKRAYVERVRRMPNGVAFGLEALTWDAMGVAQLKVGAQVNLDALVASLREIPWRPLWLEVDSGMAANDLQLCVGTHCLAPTTSVEAVLEALGKGE
ncbi:MAG: thioredoxin domain-containing protein [Puniceicoccaceae bacterium]